MKQGAYRSFSLTDGIIMKILIYGASEIGYMTALRLSGEHDITILDEQESLPEKFGNLDVSFVNGSGADVNALEQCMAAKMDLFIACSVRDESNIVACWTVKRIADNRNDLFCPHLGPL